MLTQVCADTSAGFGIKLSCILQLCHIFYSQKKLFGQSQELHFTNVCKKSPACFFYKRLKLLICDWLQVAKVGPILSHKITYMLYQQRLVNVNRSLKILINNLLLTEIKPWSDVSVRCQLQ